MTVEITEVFRHTYSLDCGRDPVFNLSQVAYLVLGDTPVLIDPGSTSASAELLTGLSRLGVGPDDIRYIIPTHIHLDHAGGSGYLIRRLGTAELVVHPRGAVHLADPSRLIQSVRAVFGDGFEDTMGPILPVPRERLHIASDGEVIKSG
ncbi:MAG: MBL fold metallo-hydrolase, partial [Chloroflexi bacterium]|nr:MBL fold metallo-hydrolase [Chloroflexota bacterium]